MKLPFTPRHLSAMPTPLRWIVQSALSLISIVMVLMMVSFITLTLGGFWLTSTPHGQKWLSSQLSSLTEGSGYTVSIGRLQALGASQIALSKLTIYSQDRAYIEAQNIILTPSLAALLQSELRLDLRASSLAVHDIPIQPQHPLPTPAAPMIPAASMLAQQLDALPLKRLSIDSLHVSQLALVDASGKTTMLLSPTFAAHATKTSAGVDITAALSTSGLLDGDAAVSAALDAHAILRGADAAMVIDTLTLTSPTLTQTLSARLGLPQTADDQSPLPFHMQAPLPDGKAIDVSAMLLAQHTGMPAITSLEASGPGVSATGAVHQADGGNWQGALDTTIDFNELAKFIPEVDSVPVKDKLALTLSFDGPTLTLAINRLHHELADLRDVKISTTPIANAPAGSRTIELTAQESTSASILKADAQLLYNDDGTSWRVENLDAALTPANAGTVTLKGRFDLANVDLILASTGLRLDRLKGPLAAANLPMRLDQTTITATGNMSAPVIDGKTRITPTTLPKGTPALSIDTTAVIKDGTATLAAKINSKAITQGQIDARMPLTLAFYPFALILPDSGLDGKAVMSGNLSALSGFLPVGLTLSGKTNLNVSATGNPMQPVTAGHLNISGGKMRDSSSGVALQDINLKGRFDNNAIIIESLAARDDKRGTLSANGRLTLAPRSWPIDATLKMNKVDPFTRSAAVISTLPVIDGTLNADLHLSGERNNYLLAGSVGSDRLDITLPATFTSSVPQLNIVEKKKQDASALPGLDALHLDVTANMPQQIFVRGWGLDAEFGGKLAITGTAAEPVGNGSLKSLRGRYEEFGRKFTLSRANLNFIGAIPPSPYLDIVAETTVDGITAQVVLGGNASKPKVSFTSSPALPQEDVLSHILFGKDRSNISPTQALQMAQTLQRFSGGGQGLDPLGKLRSGFGLDDLSVDSDEEGGTTVGAGKYISDKVYLQVGGGDKGGQAKVQVELTPNIKAESEVGQDARAGGGLFWEWDY